MNDGNLVEIGALWEKETTGAGKFLSGVIKEAVPAGTNVMLFRNKDRKNDNQPIMRIMASDKDVTVSPENQYKGGQHAAASGADGEVAFKPTELTEQNPW